MVTCQFPCYHYCYFQWQDSVLSAPMRFLLGQALCEHRSPETNHQPFPAPTVKMHFWMGGPFLHQENQRPGRLNLILQPNEQHAKYCRENVHERVGENRSQAGCNSTQHKSPGDSCKSDSEAGPTWD